MRKKTALRAPLRVFILLLLLAVAVPFGGSGCGVPGFGPQPVVPEDAAKALAKGRENVKSAEEKAAAGQDKEAERLYGAAAAYYGAVAGKFPESETGLQALRAQGQALLAQGKIQEGEAEDKGLPQALNTYHTLLRQYPAGSPLNREAQKHYDAVVARMDRENAKTPYYQALDVLVRLMGGNPRFSHVLAIFVISLGVTLGLWPLRAKQYRSMKEMQRHAPELKKIQEKYKDDKQLQQEKIMAFYKEYGFNPMAGCLPMVLQMPVLWLLYRVIYLYQFQFAKATFLWINPAAGAASAGWPSLLKGAIARNLGEQDLPLLFIYALSMYLQTRLTPATDPTQAEQQKIMAVTMPVMFFVMMLQWHLPSAFVLYWFLSNILMVAQQWRINHSLHLSPLAPGGAGGSAEGGAPPVNGNTAGNGSEEAARPLAPNQKLISPKNRKNRRK